MKKTLYLLLLLFAPLLGTHAEGIADVFKSMPDSILPLLTERNRHDMVDFYNNHMEAKVRNRLNDYAKLDTLTSSYVALTLSKSSHAALKLIETDDSMSIVCLIRTVSAPARDSRITFYNEQWQPLYWLELPTPPTAEFFTEVPDSVRSVALSAQRSIDDLRLVEVSVSPSEPVFTLTLSTALLAEDERKVARQLVRPLRYRWNGSQFIIHNA